MNKLYARGDMVTDEQVRGVTERGEWAGGWTGSGLRTEREWAGDGKRAGCGQKGSGMGAEGEWDGNGRYVGWGRKGSGVGVERKRVGRMEGM